MYATLWVDVEQTVSTIDELETMIVVDLTIEEARGSTLFVGGVHTLSTIDGFGNMLCGILTVEDTSGPTILVGWVENFQQLMNLVPSSLVYW